MRGRGAEPSWRWALQRHQLPRRAGRVVGAGGRQRRRQVDAAEDPLARHVPDRRDASSVSGRVGALIEVRAGISPLLTGRENIYPHRLDHGAQAPRRGQALRRDRRVRRARTGRRPPGQVLLVGHADAPRVRRRRLPGARRPARRRGAGGRRRHLPAALPGSDPRACWPRARRCSSSPTTSPPSRPRAPTGSGCTTAAVQATGPIRDVLARLPRGGGGRGRGVPAPDRRPASRCATSTASSPDGGPADRPAARSRSTLTLEAAEASPLMDLPRGQRGRRDADLPPQPGPRDDARARRHAGAVHDPVAARSPAAGTTSGAGSTKNWTNGDRAGRLAAAGAI